MKLKHWKGLLPPGEGLSKVCAVAFTPNNARLAVVTTSGVVHLYDENGEKRDKFSTKPAEKVCWQNAWRGVTAQTRARSLIREEDEGRVFFRRLGSSSFCSLPLNLVLPPGFPLHSLPASAAGHARVRRHSDGVQP
jgi:hypothetical protein